ncbi:MAG: MFS transporter [Acutalibacteraceae bacterium]
MADKSKTGKLSGRLLFNLILFGLIGQIAWNVENMYFNTFLYNSIYKGASQAAIDGSINVIDAVSKMVAYSAITAMLTTLIMGALSDRKGSRKRFISVGYIIWGVIIGGFGIISRDNVSAIFGISDAAKALTATVWIVIVMDMVMTFVGSTANDACFNAWVTDSTTNRNRATAESVLAFMPMAALGLVLALGGVLLAGDDVQKSYEYFFLILGAVVFVCGVIGLFTLKDVPKTVDNSGSFFNDLVYGLKPSVIRENSKLYLTLLAVCAYSIAFQVFFPYLIIYLQHSPDGFFSGDSLQITPALIAVALIAVVAMVAGIILVGKLADKYGKNKLVIPMLVLFVAGLTVLYFAHDLKLLIIGVVPTAIGYCLLGIMLNAAVRDFTPESKTGLFQGVRMIFAVMIPMVVGPYVGKKAIFSSGVYYTDDYGVSQIVPSSSMFLYAAIVCAFAVIPIVIILCKGGFSVTQNKKEQ